MKATLPINGVSGKYIESHIKDRGFIAEYAAIIVPKHGRYVETVVRVKLYQPASVVYAVLTASLGNIYGSASAKGNGYNKSVAAVEDAFRNANITLDSPLTGESDIEAAVMALADATGHGNSFFKQTHK